MARAPNSTLIRRAGGLIVALIVLGGVVVWFVSRRTETAAKQAVMSPEGLTVHYAYVTIVSKPGATTGPVPLMNEPAALAGMYGPFPVELGDNPAPLMAYLQSVLPDYSTSLLFSGSARVSRNGVCLIDAGPSPKDPLRLHVVLNLKVTQVNRSFAAGTYGSASDYVRDGQTHRGTQEWRFKEAVGKCRRFYTMPAKNGLSTLFLSFSSAAPIR